MTFKILGYIILAAWKMIQVLFLTTMDKGLTQGKCYEVIGMLKIGMTIMICLKSQNQ